MLATACMSFQCVNTCFLSAVLKQELYLLYILPCSVCMLVSSCYMYTHGHYIYLVALNYRYVVSTWFLCACRDPAESWARRIVQNAPVLIKKRHGTGINVALLHTGSSVLW